MSAEADDGALWLFGYGSLIFKPPPRYDLRVPGYIEGYVRRFWQASEDHRGTPEDPGRVVTLIARDHWESLTDHHADAPPNVWGAAYRIPPQHVAEMKEYLDIREINGYSIEYTTFNPAPSYLTSKQGSDLNALLNGSSSKTIYCLVYIGLPSNPQFLGPQEPGALAEKITNSKGPSGENSEYLLSLERALIELGPESEDVHVSDLASRCRAILSSRGVDTRLVDTRTESDAKEEVEK